MSATRSLGPGCRTRDFNDLYSDKPHLSALPSSPGASVRSFDWPEHLGTGHVYSEIADWAVRLTKQNR